MRLRAGSVRFERVGFSHDLYASAERGRWRWSPWRWGLWAVSETENRFLASGVAFTQGGLDRAVDRAWTRFSDAT